MTGRRWSLASRLRSTFALGASILVALPAAINVWVVGAQTEREVDALVREELHEAAAYLRGGERTRAQIEDIVALLSEHHGGVALSLRLWPKEAAEPDVYGATRLLDALHGRARGNATIPGHDGLRREWMRLEDGSALECTIDAREAFGRAHALQWTIAGVGLGSVAIALLVAELLARRTAGLLHSVADGVQRHSSLRAPLEVEIPDPPDEIREVVDALESLVERARQEDERTRLLISSLAHELRAPIQNLVLESEVALMSADEPEELKRVLAGQLELGRELADSVDNLVALCRSNDPDDALPVERFDVGHEARLRSNRWKRSAAHRSVDLQLATRGELELTGDREAALRALRNLVANAIEWSPAGSVVEVEIVGEDDAVELRVHDRGPGMADADRVRAFEPFVRLDEGGDRRAGYGLGLSIVRRAAERFGGSARLDARPGGGTSAVLRLPRTIARRPVAVGA